MNHLLSCLLLFLLHLGLLANNYQFKIGYIDFDDDIRYADWGRHPVDIRSQHNHQPRAIDGAILGVNEAKRIQRITKIKVTMKHFRIKNENALYDFLISSDIKEFKVILLDISIKNPEKIARLLQANKNIIFFNVSDQNNLLRSDICLENLFHTFPSDLMRTDSLAQFLVEKKWNKTLMLTGSLEEDKRYANSFKKSAKKFGIKIVKEKFFVNSNDPRIREKNDLAFLTKGSRYNSIFISDVDGEFALSVPNNSVSPATIIGSSGLIPLAWHWSNLRYGAPQVNGRFERKFNRRMLEKDWSAWIAIKSITESLLRTKSVKSQDLKNYLISKNFKVDGSKGISLNYRPDSKQLRQTILLVSGNNWVTATAPLENFQNRDNNLDTIGYINDKDKCKATK